MAIYLEKYSNTHQYVTCSMPSHMHVPMPHVHIQASCMPAQPHSTAIHTRNKSTHTYTWPGTHHTFISQTHIHRAHKQLTLPYFRLRVCRESAPSECTIWTSACRQQQITQQQDCATHTNQLRPSNPPLQPPSATLVVYTPHAQLTLIRSPSWK